MPRKARARKANDGDDDTDLPGTPKKQTKVCKDRKLHSEGPNEKQISPVRKLFARGNSSKSQPMDLKAAAAHTPAQRKFPAGVGSPSTSHSKQMRASCTVSPKSVSTIFKCRSEEHGTSAVVIACKFDCRRFAENMEAAYAKDPDYLRLDYIKQSCPGITRVLGCSERDPFYAGGQAAELILDHAALEPDHIHSADFGNPAVLKSFRDRVGVGTATTTTTKTTRRRRTGGGGGSGGPELILFDYFWLQTGHYRRRYGTRWLSDWVPAAFGLPMATCESTQTEAFGLDCKGQLTSTYGTTGAVDAAAGLESLALPNLQCVILPVDGGRDGCAEVSDMMRMLKEYQASPQFAEHAKKITVTTMSLLEAETYHPLVLATRLADPELVEMHKSRCHDSQVKWLLGWRDGGAHMSAQGCRLAKGGGPSFVVIHRRGLDWREWLLKLQQLPKLRGARVRVRSNPDGTSATTASSAPSRRRSRPNPQRKAAAEEWVYGRVENVVLPKDKCGQPQAAPLAHIAWDDGSPKTTVTLTEALRMLDE